MNRITQIRQQIAELEKELKWLQEACTHPPLALRFQYGSNTGNYDPSSDCYWTDFHCTLCEKRWRQEDTVNVSDLATQVRKGEEL